MGLRVTVRTNNHTTQVGGSQGFACFAIARKFPALSFVVQDLEPVIQAAEKEVPNDLVDRVRFMTHDFLLEDQPVKGGDVYFFRWILHNWSDKYCVKILRGLIPALKPGAKIVLNDNVLPQPGVLSRWQENRLRYVFLVGSVLDAAITGVIPKLTTHS